MGISIYSTGEIKNSVLPAFSATNTTTVQSIPNNTYTKIQYNSEIFDTNNCFDSTTNYRFTPNVAGYYQINGTVSLEMNINNTPCFALLYKNGSAYLWGQANGAATAYPTASVSSVVYLNGSTDYVEIYVLQTSGASRNTVVATGYMGFSGALVRAA